MWIDMARVAVAPTLTDDERQSRIGSDDADDGPAVKRQRARLQYEHVCKATCTGDEVVSTARRTASS
jgi:hypothetical protein